jgi:hypothetical protein
MRRNSTLVDAAYTQRWLMLAMEIFLAQELYIAVVLLLASASRGSP